VLRLAHDSVFGGHLGERNTRERIRLSFFWPELRKSVLDYVRHCAKCQLRSMPMTTDRVPITPDKARSGYVSRYNLRARHKRFQEGLGSG